MWISENAEVATISDNMLTIVGAGTSTITATQVGNDDYKPFSRTYTLTVAKAPLTIAAKNYTMMEGATLPTFEATYSGFKHSDTPTALSKQPTFTCSATSESLAGTYPITVSGATAANYNITFVAGTLTVLEKPSQSLALTTLLSMTYGDADYTLPSQTEEGFALTWSSSNTSVAAISDNTLAVKGAGTATITATQAGNDEYKPFSKEFTLTVAKAQLTITANNATKNVGKANPVFTASYEGFVGEDDATVLTTQPTLTCEATTESPAGTYDIVVSDAEAANYEMVYVNGSLTIVDEMAQNNHFVIANIEVSKGGSVVLPISMNNTESVTAFQFEVSLPNGITLSKCELTERKGDHTVSFSKLANGNYQVTALSLSSESFSGTEGALVNLTLNVDDGMETGEYAVSIKNIELTTTGAVGINPADVTATLTVSDVLIADTNGDGKVSITDAVAVVNYILGNASAAVTPRLLALPPPWFRIMLTMATASVMETFPFPSPT